MQGKSIRTKTDEIGICFFGLSVPLLEVIEAGSDSRCYLRKLWGELHTTPSLLQILQDRNSAPNSWATRTRERLMSFCGFLELCLKLNNQLQKPNMMLTRRTSHIRESRSQSSRDSLKSEYILFLSFGTSSLSSASCAKRLIPWRQIHS